MINSKGIKKNSKRTGVTIEVSFRTDVGVKSIQSNQPHVRLVNNKELAMKGNVYQQNLKGSFS